MAPIDFEPYSPEASPMSIQAMEDLAWKHGAVVIRGAISTAAIVFSDSPEHCHVICLPKNLEADIESHLLAHELGHLVLGHGKLGGYNNGIKPNKVMEIEANHFAERITGKLPDPRGYRAWWAATFRAESCSKAS